MSQKTKEQTLPGRELMHRSDDDAGSSLVFTEFADMEVKGDLGRFSRAAGVRMGKLTALRLKKEVRKQRHKYR